MGDCRVGPALQRPDPRNDAVLGEHSVLGFMSSHTRRILENCITPAARTIVSYVYCECCCVSVWV